MNPVAELWTDPELNPTDDLSFLEGPTIALTTLPLGDLTDEQIDALLADLRPLNQVPGARTLRIRDESTELVTGKPRVKRGVSKVNKMIDDLV